MPSTTYDAMVANLAALRKELLPRTLGTARTYRPQWHSRTSAYRVLAHAEIESYLEERAKGLVVAALTQWRSQAKLCRLLLGLVAFGERTVSGPPKTLQAPQASQTKLWPDLLELGNRVEACSSAYVASLKKNHGIKEANVLAILLPLGLPPVALDPTWLTLMNSFGEDRGAVAHGARLRQGLDPKAEFDRVTLVLTPLATIDSELEKLIL